MGILLGCLKVLFIILLLVFAIIAFATDLGTSIPFIRVGGVEGRSIPIWLLLIILSVVLAISWRVRVIRRRRYWKYEKRQSVRHGLVQTSDELRFSVAGQDAKTSLAR